MNDRELLLAEFRAHVAECDRKLEEYRERQAAAEAENKNGWVFDSAIAYVEQVKANVLANIEQLETAEGTVAP